jgi:hypothetical protein
VRNYIANDASFRTVANMASAVAALKRILCKDTSTISVTDFYTYPGISLKLDDEYTREAIPSNNQLLQLMIVNSVKNSDALMTIHRMKDRLRDLFDDRSNKPEHKRHTFLTAQASTLGYDVKFRGTYWVNAWTYDDIEQGSERLHRIICLVRLVIGE